MAKGRATAAQRWQKHKAARAAAGIANVRLDLDAGQRARVRHAAGILGLSQAAFLRSAVLEVADRTIAADRAGVARNGTE